MKQMVIVTESYFHSCSKMVFIVMMVVIIVHYASATWGILCYFFCSVFSKVCVGRDAIPAMMGDTSAIESEGVKPLDASHVAAAIYSGCDYFITTDDRMLRYRSDKIRIVDPVQFIKETEARE